MLNTFMQIVGIKGKQAQEINTENVTTAHTTPSIEVTSVNAPSVTEVKATEAITTNKGEIEMTNNTIVNEVRTAIKEKGLSVTTLQGFTVAQLEEFVSTQELTVSEGTGKNGNIIKQDYIRTIMNYITEYRTTKEQGVTQEATTTEEEDNMDENNEVLAQVEAYMEQRAEEMDQKIKEIKAKYQSLADEKQKEIDALKAKLEGGEKKVQEEAPKQETKKEESTMNVKIEDLNVQNAEEAMRAYVDNEEKRTELQKAAEKALGDRNLKQVKEINKLTRQLSRQATELERAYPKAIFTEERVSKLRTKSARMVRETADTTHGFNATVIEQAHKLVAKTNDIIASAAHKANDGGRKVAHKAADKIEKK